MSDYPKSVRCSRIWSLGACFFTGLASLQVASAQILPEAPSTLLAGLQSQAPLAVARTDPAHSSSEETQKAQELPQCPADQPPQQDEGKPPCQRENPLQPIVETKRLAPMTPGEKGYLAVRDVIDPFNLITVIGYSGIVVASNAHTAYGPGLRGFGRLAGYSMVEDMQGEFFGTFLIPTLVHQDPRYYRMPGRPFGRRLLNALSHTVVTRGDDGHRMPNYATLATYPISAELMNLYVPGVQTNSASTAKRIALGLATDPVGQIVAEFLPDVAKRIHIRVIFVQQILQQVAQGGTGGPVMTQ